MPPKREKKTTARKPPPKKITISEKCEMECNDDMEGGNIFDGVNLGNLTARSAEMYKKKKDAKITSLQLFRRPVEDALTGVMDAFTGNAVSKYFKSTSHDKLFHLGLIINGKFLYHKQANIAIESMPNGFRKGKKIELKPVTGFSKDLTFKDMYRRTRDEMGEKKFYDYDSFKNNCQDFIIDTLDTIGATYDKDWVKQDVEEIVEESPSWFPSLAKALTDTASVAEKVVGGGVDDKPKKRRGRPRKEKPEDEKLKVTTRGEALKKAREAKAKKAEEKKLAVGGGNPKETEEKKDDKKDDKKKKRRRPPSLDINKCEDPRNDRDGNDPPPPDPNTSIIGRSVNIII